tara:strand:- start:148 stop:378 length:231 start_codon:yes stop_codon:yes gene_type:complete
MKIDLVIASSPITLGSLKEGEAFVWNGRAYIRVHTIEVWKVSTLDALVADLHSGECFPVSKNAVITRTIRKLIEEF